MMTRVQQALEDMVDGSLTALADAGILTDDDAYGIEEWTS